MAAAPGDHPRGQGVGEDDRGPEVDVDRPVDLFDRVGRQASGARDGRIGHQHVDVASRYGQTGDRVRVRQVGRQNLGAELVGQGLEHGDPATGQDRLGTSRRQSPGDRRARRGPVSRTPLAGELHAAESMPGPLVLPVPPPSSADAGSGPAARASSTAEIASACLVTPIETRCGRRSSGFGTRTSRTPSRKLASMLWASTPSGRVSDRANRPDARSIR